MSEVKLKPYMRKALKEIATITDKDIQEDERGKFILNASGDARDVIEFLSKDKKLGPSFRKFVKKWDIEYGKYDGEVVVSAVYVKPLPNDKYLVTLHFMTENVDTLNDSAEYQFVVDYKGLVNFLQHT
jgi:DNA polymerase III delta prime subunit